MASMTVDSISAYHLRKDTLLEYLRSVFPTHTQYITVEVSITQSMACYWLLQTIKSSSQSLANLTTETD